MADIYAAALLAFGGFLWGIWPEIRRHHDTKRRNAERRERIAEEYRRPVVVYTADGFVRFHWPER